MLTMLLISCSLCYAISDQSKKLINEATKKLEVLSMVN